MFAIDLLKGKATPARRSLKKTALKAIPFLVPVMAVVLWADSYQQDCAEIRRQQTQIKQNQAVIDAARGDVKEYRQLKGQIAEVKQTLNTLTKGLNYRVQISDVLLELTQTLPDQIFLYEINLDRTTQMQKLPQEKGKEPKQRLLVQRNMKLIVCGYEPAQSDLWVREYVNALKSSEMLAAVFTEIKPASRRQGIVEEKPATFYEIECTLAEQG